MDTRQLKAYAPEARKRFIEAVRMKAATYGLTAKKTEPATEKGDVVMIDGVAFSKTIAKQRNQLVERINKEGFEPFIESVAYTWFNRFVAIRFMEINGYLSHGHRVLSAASPDKAVPEILENATRIELPGVDRQSVQELQLDGTKDEELYRMLLIGQCNALNQAMPFLFEWIGEGTELLLPDNLLHSDSLIRTLVNDIPEEQWKQVEVIGWLYQFYISARKDEVIGKAVASEDIPAATQLFTPNWIVKYLVQNTLGRQWMAVYPDSPLKNSMEFYIEPGEQAQDVVEQLKSVTPPSLNPEELTFLDPACGSGHILVEAYDLFKAIYLERGYRLRDIPALILGKNLYGLEIDERAAQLAGFALMMKAREDDRRLLDLERKDRPQPNIVCFEESGNLSADEIARNLTLPKEDATAILELFKHAKTFGSLIRISESIQVRVPVMRERLELVKSNGDMLHLDAVKQLEPFVRQAEMLSQQYDFVVANPPYMGSKGMNRQLKDFAEKQFPDTKSDLFAMFIERNGELAKENGDLGFMSPFVWMFISSYEKLRERLIGGKTITSLVQLEYSGFDGATVPICTFTYNNNHWMDFKGGYVRLSEFRGSENQGPKTLEAIRDPGCGWFYRASADDFKKIPGSPVAYWVPNFDIFEEDKICKDWESGGRIKTHDGEKYIRYIWETSRITTRWKRLIKGGDYRKHFGNEDFLVDWSQTAISFYEEKGGLYPKKFHEKEGICWSKITSALQSFRIKRSVTEYDSASPTIFNKNFKCDYYVLALLNSTVSQFLLKAINPTLNTQLVDVMALPYCIISPSAIKKITAQEEDAVLISKTDWDSYETSWDFTENPLVSLAREEM